MAVSLFYTGKINGYLNSNKPTQHIVNKALYKCGTRYALTIPVTT